MSAEKTVTVPSVAAMRWINGLLARAETAIVAVLEFIAHLTDEAAASHANNAVHYMQGLALAEDDMLEAD